LDTLDVGHRDLCEIVSVILKISHNKAANLVKFTKHERSRVGAEQGLQDSFDRYEKKMED
jgi:hypothetical protein